MSGGSAHARPMLAAGRGGFVERYDLWTDAHSAAAFQIRRVIDEPGIEIVRIVVPRPARHAARQDAHARRLRPRARVRLLCALLAGAQGHLAADRATPSSGRDAVADVPQLTRRRRLVLVPDPTTFRVLPWAERHRLGALRPLLPGRLARCRSATRRALSRRLLANLAERGYDHCVGLEVEFHVFRARRPAPRIRRYRCSRAQPPSVSPLTHGFSCCPRSSSTGSTTSSRSCAADSRALDLPLRSLELEFGPSQIEATFEPRLRPRRGRRHGALPHAPIRQICRRNGYHATFMSRPRAAEHRLQRLASASVARRPRRRRERLPRPGPTTRTRCRNSAAASSAGCSRHAARRHRLHDADRQRLQALQAVLAGPRPDRPGASTTAARWSGLVGGPGDPAPPREPLGRACREPVPLHGVAARRRARRRSTASSSSGPPTGLALRRGRTLGCPPR